MATLETSALINAIIELLTEAYAGPPNPSATWFIDNEPDSGILGILKGVTAAEASKSVDGSGKSGSTIASNVEHLRWSLANANGDFRGEPYRSNWGESWERIQVSENEWERLREELRVEYETLRQAIQRQEDLQGDTLIGVLGLIPHAAFHLGLIRQMLERVRA
jgi:hypothetical protein